MAQDWEVYRLVPTDGLMMMMMMMNNSYGEKSEIKHDKISHFFPSMKLACIEWVHYYCIILIYHALSCGEKFKYNNNNIIKLTSPDAKLISCESLFFLILRSGGWMKWKFWRIREEQFVCGFECEFVLCGGT